MATKLPSRVPLAVARRYQSALWHATSGAYATAFASTRRHLLAEARRAAKKNGAPSAFMGRFGEAFGMFSNRRRAGSRDEFNGPQAAFGDRLREVRDGEFTIYDSADGFTWQAVLVALPHGRGFIPGYRVEGGGDDWLTLDVSGAIMSRHFTREAEAALRHYRLPASPLDLAKEAAAKAEKEAAYQARRMAERACERESEYQQGWHAGLAAAEARGDALREARALVAEARNTRTEARALARRALSAWRSRRVVSVPRDFAFSLIEAARGLAAQARAVAEEGCDKREEAWRAWHDAAPSRRRDDSFSCGFWDGAYAR